VQADSLPWVCLYDPGAVKVVVIRSRIAGRQDAPRGGGMDLTTTLGYTGRQRSVPHPAVATEAGQGVAAMHGVARVTAVQNHSVSKVAFIPDPIAIVRDSWILTLY